MYIYYDINTKVEMENGVITVPGGETMWINVEGIAKDYSKVQTSETSPITPSAQLEKQRTYFRSAMMGPFDPSASTTFSHGKDVFRYIPHGY